MGSTCEIQAWLPDGMDDGILAQAAEEAFRLERKYSRYRNDSIVSRINQAAGTQAVEVDDETAALLDFASVAWEQSGGMFDITSGILRRAWDFTSGQLPQQQEIDKLLPLIGWNKVQWHKPAIFLPQPWMQIDFGGIVKEYAADRVAGFCLSQGLKHGLVNLGGDIQVFGPQPNGDPWLISVRRTRGEGFAAAIPLHKGAFATSGDYERFMDVDGKRYCHILNPRTGWPCAEWQSVSVIAPQCIIAGLASTVGMLKPREEAAQWLQALGLPHLLLGDNTQQSHRLQIAGQAKIS